MTPSLPWTESEGALLLGRAPFLTPVLVFGRPRPWTDEDNLVQIVYRTVGDVAVKKADGEARTRDLILTMDALYQTELRRR